MGAVAHAAEHRNGADIGKTGKIAEGGLDLRGKFAGGFEDENARAAVGAETREHGQGECGGFTGAGLRRRDEIAAAENDGDGAKLNGSRVDVAGGLDATEDLLGKIECFKSHRCE